MGLAAHLHGQLQLVARRKCPGRIQVPAASADGAEAVALAAAVVDLLDQLGARVAQDALEVAAVAEHQAVAERALSKAKAKRRLLSASRSLRQNSV